MTNTQHTQGLAAAGGSGVDRPDPERRRFLVTALAAGGGLMLGFEVPFGGRIAEAAGTATRVGVWASIATDETVTIQVGSQEMGQGAMTGLAQLFAEELMVDWPRVRAVMAPAGAAYVNPVTRAQFTAGSMSIRGFYQSMRRAGATLREMLKIAAARQWGLPVTAVTAAAGRVTAPGRSATYGQLAAAAATVAPPAAAPLLGTGRIVGRPVRRTDIPAKVDGSAVFGIDVRLPGMVYAAVGHGPVFGATLPANWKPAAPAGVLKVLNLGDAVAVVVASNTWAAFQALARLAPPWIMPPAAVSAMADSAAVAARAKALLTATTPKPAVAETTGDADRAIAGAAKVLDQTYSVPFLAHACLEPLNATVHYTKTACRILAPTQAPGSCVATAAALTGLPAAAVTVEPQLMGGGMGRKFEQDFIAQAVKVAMALPGRPVKLTWPRAEDFGRDFYRPATTARIRAGLDARGAVVGWTDRIVSPSILAPRFVPNPPAGFVDGQVVDGATTATGLGYALGARRVEWMRQETGLPIGFWRSVGHGVNCFLVESAIDELAKLAGQDPYLFRRRLLAADARTLAVLDAAARLGDWPTTVPPGNARGIAVSKGFGSITAQVAEVSRDSAGGIVVERVSVAIDCGLAINPDQVAAQMEGAVVQALANALWSRMTFTKGRADQRNFDAYRPLRLRETPQIAVTIIQGGGGPGGVGEPGVPATAPAVANAWAALTGTRIRALPMFPAPVRPSADRASPDEASQD